MGHRKRVSAVAVLFVIMMTTCGMAEDVKVKAFHYETYTGIDVMSRDLGSGSATTWAPFSPVTGEGFRLRASAYSSVYGEAASDIFAGRYTAKNARTYADVMAGYALNYGSVWAKVYLGAAYQGDTRLYREVSTLRAKADFGAKAAVETWWNLGDRSWAGMNVSYVEIDKTASLYSKLGYDFIRFKNGLTVAFGAEVGATQTRSVRHSAGRTSDEPDDLIRGGGLLALRYGRHDLNVSFGAAREDRMGDISPYAALSYGRKF